MDSTVAGEASLWVSRSIDRVLELWGAGFSRLGPDHQPTLVLMILVGALLLLVGRKAFWVALSALGFLLGWLLAGWLLDGQASQSTPWFWALAFCGGLLGMFLAVTVQRLAASLAGFAMGGLLGAKLLPLTPLADTPWGLGLPLVLALAGLLLGVRLLELALRIVTSGVGAALLVAAARLGVPFETLLFVALWGFGFFLQRPRR